MTPEEAISNKIEELEYLKKGRKMDKIINTYKGFDKNLCCRDMQYEIGKSYEEPNAGVCNKGFHACERPLDVFKYYPPATSRFCETEQSGEISKASDDTKVSSTKIKIGAEIGIPGLVKAQIEWTKAHTTNENTDSDRATAGDYGAATAGKYGAATAGYCGAATSRGSAAVGADGLAVARGYGVKVRGGLGAILVIAEENITDYNVMNWIAAQVDGVAIKADTWYRLNKDGHLEEICELKE
uniref:DUF7666 domain-containing protein n=1 Tax=Siphoviridae sp. ct0uL16 TaxID=2825299 RepID=A0A8S5Q663_9CAUD|nr:MAG TPA: hypothetical protein [Siphoviridae sp. ct0uL16]